MKKSALIGYRLGKPEDIPFIFSSWLKGIRFGNDAFRKVPSKYYYKVMHARLDSILQTPGCVVTVACLKTDPDTVLGYSVSNHNTLHWVFVKKGWRGIGIGRDLTPITTTKITMTTRPIEALLKSYPLIEVEVIKL